MPFSFRPMISIRTACLPLAIGIAAAVAHASEPLRWQPLPALPDALGVAGPFVGIHDGAVIVAGGANFPVAPGEDRWTVPKRWQQAVWVLPRDGSGWLAAAPLPRPRAGGAVASIPAGVVCIGGDDGTTAVATVTLLRWDPGTGQVVARELPPLPHPLTACAAAALGSVVYVAGGQRGTALDGATAAFLRLDCRPLDRGVPAGELHWEALPDVPGGPRALPVVVARGSGAVHVISGRRSMAGGAAAAIEALVDHWEFDAARVAADPGSGWIRRAPLPQPAMAGSAVAAGAAHIVVVSGDDGALWERTAILRDAHPGFTPRALAYGAAADRWTSLAAPPVNQLATPAVPVTDGFILVSGEVKPRHRSPAAWRVSIDTDALPVP
ncbi:MAG: hypothetical protein KGQ61_12710 [Planctomycetes bacterium]|nr:hypothetical protein [Planctomycetota bacterium]